ncbi:MAG: adenine phosphoribosyltransferase [Pseudomonadota bacterium]
MRLEDHIRTIPDFPQPGIMFRDVTTLFLNAEAFAASIEQLAARIEPHKVDLVAGIEARGFVLGGALATRLNAGFVPLRKKGKLPGRTLEEAYALEYGQAVIEVHDDAAGDGHRVAVIDDLIATGGTGLAGMSLIRRLGAEPVVFGALVDLPDLGGSAKLAEAGAPVECLMTFPGH